MSVDLNTHALLAMAAFDDDLAPVNAAEGYWRGFLLQDRATGALSFEYRFHYTDVENGGTKRSWYRLTFNDNWKSLGDLDAQIDAIRTKVLSAMLAMTRMHIPDAPESVYSWHVVPAADRGDFKRTLIWMEMQDLVHEPEFKERT
jgi:hypothetical protein